MPGMKEERKWPPKLTIINADDSLRVYPCTVQVTIIGDTYRS